MDPFAVWRHRADQTYPYGDPPPGVLRTGARVLWRRFGTEASIIVAVLAWVVLILAVSGCAGGDPNRAAMVWGAALQSAAQARPADPPAFTHYMTPGDGMTTCHHLGGGVAHCF